MALRFKNQSVDRAWLRLIAVSAVIWTTVTIARIGWLPILALFLLGLALGYLRHWYDNHN